MRRAPLMVGLFAMAAQSSSVAAAEPAGLVPAARMGQIAPVSLAGDRLLVTRQTRRGFRLVSVPLAGGPARTLFATSAGSRYFQALTSLDAVPERVAFSMVEISRHKRRPVRVSVWHGGVTGPLGRLIRVRSSSRGWVPSAVHAGAGAVGVMEARLVPEDSRQFVFPVGGSRVPVTSTRRIDDFDLAGGLVAFVERQRVLVVKDWATGAERLRYSAPGDIEDYDLAEDGRVLLHVFSKRTFEVVSSASRAVQRVPIGRGFGDIDVKLAGRFAVLRTRGRFSGDGHIEAVDLASGQRRRLSPSSLDLENSEAPLDVHGDMAAWAANGCAFVARISAKGSTTVPRGPCARAEILLEEEQPKRLRGRTARVRIRCITAPARGCRGTVTLRLDRALGIGRFAIAPGRSGTARVRLTRRAYAELKREAQGPLPGGGVLVGVRTRLRGGLNPRGDVHQGILLRPGH